MCVYLYKLTVTIRQIGNCSPYNHEHLRWDLKHHCSKTGGVCTCSNSTWWPEIGGTLELLSSQFRLIGSVTEFILKVKLKKKINNTVKN